MDQFIKYGAISFNATFAAALKFSDFCEHEKHHNLSKDEMKEVHDACKSLVGFQRKTANYPPDDQDANQMKTPAGE